MRESHSPSIVPDALDRDVYLVLDNFGDRLGWAWPETDVAHTDRATMIRHLLEGQYSSPVRADSGENGVVPAPRLLYS